MKTTASRASAVSQTRGFGDLLYDKAGARPSLDLDFAGTSSLRDKITGEYLVDHTRASVGTYIDSEGLVKEAPINYLHNTDNPTLWGKGSNTTLTANAFTAPDGTQTAHRVQMIAGQGTYLGIPASAVVAGETYVYSVWLKKNGSNTTTSLFINNATTVGGSTDPHYQVTLTDEWQRFTRVFTVPSTTLTVQIDNFGSQAEDFLFWQPQVEKGSVATDYIKTTASQTNSAPRFTHERVETGNLLTHSENFVNDNYVISNNSVSIQDYAGISPSGKYDAALITAIGSGDIGHNFRTTNISTVKAGKKYTITFHAKATATEDQIFVNLGTNDGGYVNTGAAKFTLSGDGTFSHTAGSGHSITKGDNGWYRCQFITQELTTTVQARIQIKLQRNGTFTASNPPEALYFWGLQVEEGELATTYVPSINTFTSRQSNATYVDSAGLVKTSSYNWLNYSEDISQWSKRQHDGGTATVTNTSETNPIGESGAYLISLNHTQTNSSSWVQPNALSGAGGIMTASAYIKAGVASDVGKIINFWQYDGGVKNHTYITLTADWQRVTFNNSESLNSNINEPSNIGLIANPSQYDTGVTSVSFYLWGVQVRTGFTAGEYTKTTGTANGAARYSHDYETLTPTGLYLEPAATNLLTYSNDFSQWTKSSDTTVLTETTSAPDGSSVPWIEVGDYISREVSSPSNGTTYTGSVWLKAETPCTTKFRLMYVESKIETINLTNEWKRFELTGTYSSNLLRIQVDNRDDLTASTIKIGIWGAQVEEGNYATSHIPTPTSSTVTRAADVYTSTTNLTETFEPRGLLIEEARTNTATHSNFSDFLNEGITMTTATDINSPMGTTDGVTKIQSNTTNTAHMIYEAATYSSSAMSATFFVKSLGTSVDLMLRLNQVGNPTATLIYNLDNETVKYPQGVSGTGSTGDTWSFTKGIFEKYPNGWYRVGFKNLVTSASSQRFSFKIVPRDSIVDHPTWTGTGQPDYAIFGFQKEEGKFPTSLILTSGSTVTRAADVASISGDNFGTYRTNYISKPFQPWEGGLVPTILDRYVYPNPLDGQHNAHLIGYEASGLFRLKIGCPANSTSIIVSAYVKPVSNPCFLQIYSQRQAAGRANFDLINKTHNANNNGTASIEDVGNGWLRVKWITPTSNSAQDNVTFSLKGNSLNNARNSGDQSVTNKLYFYAPQVELGNQVTNFIPATDTFTSRLSSATYVDSTGLIKSINKNLILRSEELNHSAWDRGGPASDWTANNVMDPNGNMTADSWSYDSTKLAFYNETASSFMSGYPAVYPFTITTEWVRHSVSVTTEANQTSMRVYTHRTADDSQYHYQTVTVEPQTTYTYSAYHKKVGTKVIVWGAQLVKGSEAQEYVKTTNTSIAGPRYSHDPETLVPTGLYLEPAATNVLPYHYLVNQLIAVTQTANAATAPDGTQTATRIAEQAVTNRHIAYQAANAGIPSNSTVSVFIKGETVRYVGVILHIGGGDLTPYIIDTQEGIITQTNPTSTFSNEKLEKYPNGWYRFSYYHGTGNNGNLVLCSSQTPTTTSGVVLAAGSPNFAGNTSNTYLYWGLQVETGSVLSSPILSAGSATTRAADTFSSTATTVLDRDGGNKEAFWSPTANTMFGEMKYINGLTYPRLAEFVNNNGGEVISNFIDHASGVFNTRMMTQAATQYNNVFGTAKVDSFNKFATSYQKNDHISIMNGALSSQDTTVNLHVLPSDTKLPTQLFIGDRDTADRATNVPIKRITHWKSRLPDASLINITT